MEQWKRDLRVGLLILTAMLLTAAWVLAAVWLLARPEGESVAAVGRVEAPCVAITFDDGPRRETTTLLLDGLAQRGVHATFFVVGTRVEGKEDILRRMAADGHQVGIHSQNHKDLSLLDENGLSAEIDTLRSTLTGILGEKDFMLRPPYGFISGTLLGWTKEPIILWSVDPEDWSDHDVERQVSVVLNSVKDGDIILLHDVYYASVETALQVVDALLAKGYRLVTVEELFTIRGIKAEAGREYRSLPGS